MLEDRNSNFVICSLFLILSLELTFKSKDVIYIILFLELTFKSKDMAYSIDYTCTKAAHLERLVETVLYYVA